MMNSRSGITAASSDVTSPHTIGRHTLGTVAATDRRYKIRESAHTSPRMLHAYYASSTSSIPFAARRKSINATKAVRPPHPYAYVAPPATNGNVRRQGQVRSLVTNVAEQQNRQSHLNRLVLQDEQHGVRQSIDADPIERTEMLTVAHAPNAKANANAPHHHHHEHASLPIIEAFVDGSYRPQENKAGAGVFFSMSNLRRAPVPAPPKAAVQGIVNWQSSEQAQQQIAMPYDPVRAELFAAVMAVKASREANGFAHELVLKQDSVIAIVLLRRCNKYGLPPGMRPTIWARSPQASNWRISFPWGDVVSAKTILAYGDVLDWYWKLSHSIARIRNEWVKAHLHVEEAKNTRDWFGNGAADILAKSGAKMS